jgi:hypothetical protein
MPDRMKQVFGRAGCGKSARPVRRGGGISVLSVPSLLYVRQESGADFFVAMIAALATAVSMFLFESIAAVVIFFITIADYLVCAVLFGRAIGNDERIESSEKSGLRALLLLCGPGVLFFM